MNKRFHALISILALALPALAQTTTSRALVVLGEYTINGYVYYVNCGASQVNDILFANPDGFSVRQALNEASYGQYLLTGDVYGPYRMAADDLATNGALRCGSYSVLGDRLKAIVAGQGVDLSKYDRFIYVLPYNAGCDISAGGIWGNTDIQGRKNWIFACDDEMVYEHEIGHTLLGGNHSVDDADPMNGQNITLRLFNAAGTLQLGWMAAAGISDIYTDGTYVIAPLEFTRADTSLPQIYRLHTSAQTYALSYRQPYGVDRRMGNNQNNLRVNNIDPNRNLVRAIPSGGSTTLDNVTIQNLSNSPGNLALSIRGAGGGPPPPPPPPSCTPSSTTLCLRGGRFSVTANWKTGSSSGAATAIPFSNDTGYFWFFSPNNTELAVKILDGNPVNGHFWVFYGGLTNLEYTITVTDVTTGTAESYHNLAGSVCGGSDVSFGVPGGASTGGVTPQVTSGLGAPTTCTPDANTLCLQPGGDTIKVQVTWRNGSQSGVGSGGLLPNTNQAGYFTFFSPSNVELLAKVLDGRAVNQRYWVFTGALTDVEYAITFTDIASGRWVTVHNTQGNYCGSAITDQLY